MRISTLCIHDAEGSPAARITVIPAAITAAIMADRGGSTGELSPDNARRIPDETSHPPSAVNRPNYELPISISLIRFTYPS